MKLESSSLLALFRATLGCAALLAETMVGIAGESDEHPPGVALNPAVVITTPKPMFPPEIEAMRSEIDVEQARLRKEAQYLAKLAASKDEPADPEAIESRRQELLSAWTRLIGRHAILQQMLDEHRARIARAETDTPFDPDAAEAPATPANGDSES